MNVIPGGPWGLRQGRNRLSLNVIALSGQRAYKVIQVPSNCGTWRPTPRDNWRQPRQGPALNADSPVDKTTAIALAPSAEPVFRSLLDLREAA